MHIPGPWISIILFPLMFFSLTLIFRFLSRPEPNLKDILQIAIQLCMLNISAYAGTAMLVLDRMKRNIPLQNQGDPITALQQIFAWAVIFAVATALCALAKRILIKKCPNTEFIWADLMGMLILCLGIANLSRIATGYGIF
jgi:hypothetical protein